MRIFNTKSREKEEFQPIEPGHVKIYVCGPTVYNFFHLGNARPFVTYDTLRRYLEFRGYQVTYVQNFTDIDDKMIKRANADGITIKELADRFIKEYFYDADRLNIRRATFHPRATDSMAMIIELIQTLMDKGFAYEAEDGVYFSVAKMPDYGKLSHHNLEELEFDASDRLNQEGRKQNTLDFALWKKKKENEPFWPSPWGDGRPGWHIECSAMVKQYLGDTIDIHGGGQDLIFPHHENEIAQSECANGKTFVRYWMHNGFINVDQEKMSKSAGNFFTVRDLTQHYDYIILRFFMLGGHYRMPINFSAELLTAAQNGWARIRTCLENLEFISSSAPAELAEKATGAANDLAVAREKYRQAFIEAMDDDLNTADALAAIFELVRAANTAAAVNGLDLTSIRQTLDLLNELLDVLGLRVKEENLIPEDVMALVEARTQAKKQRDFQLADALRAQIQAKGFIVMDTPQGPKVSKA
ncbi:MAG TPA: cysteine--tRNA ligase [Clostridiales bacterium]|nr:cysteine--tRNA ligase [Clostridiales bacterium]